ncbi:MAG: DUF1573 domain-containing protein [Bacteroidota bacterium]
MVKYVYKKTAFFAIVCLSLLTWACGGENQAAAEAPTAEATPSSINTSPPAIDSTVSLALDSSKLEVSDPPQVESDPEGVAVKVVDAKEEKAKKKKRSSSKKRRSRKKARVQFEEMVHQYETIKQGETVKHQFRFKNTGKTPLIIKNVRASCGCTQPSYPFIPIEAGEEGYIGVVFDTKGKLGKQKPVITVETNADPSTYKLYLEGYVDAE